MADTIAATTEPPKFSFDELRAKLTNFETLYAKAKASALDGDPEGAVAELYDAQAALNTLVRWYEESR